jgi:hypothetical protein
MTTWKDRLRPFADHIETMATMIRLLEDEDLKKLGAACCQPTQTNCGWSTYQAAKVIEREVGAELYRRKQKRESASTVTSPHE